MMSDAKRHNRLVEWLEQAALDMPKEELIGAAAAAFPGLTVGEFKRSTIDMVARIRERDEERAAMGLPKAIG
ncbi:hypothetical protein [Mesorhizobium sp. M0060]|uniref:hypothetical protein n=1 Tax=Mesorhizobium sp. M0060 TaxID=2956866 RepID=UPI0033374379